MFYVHISYILYFLANTVVNTTNTMKISLEKQQQHLGKLHFYGLWKIENLFFFDSDSDSGQAKVKDISFVRSFVRSLTDRTTLENFWHYFRKKHKRISTMSVSAILWIGHTWVGADGGYLPVEVDAMLVGMTCLVLGRIDMNILFYVFA